MTGKGLHKLPPQATDLEETVLGCALLERHGQLIALEKLTAEDFYEEKHQIIFRAIEALAAEGIGIEMRSVTNQLRKTDKLEAIGGAYAIAALTSSISSAANIEYYCAVIQEKRILRDMIGLADDLYQKAYDSDADPFKLLDDISAFPVHIIDKVKSGSEKHIKEGIVALGLNINSRTADTKPLEGLPTGYQSLDKVLRGLKPGNLILMASRPSMGKTTCAVNIARNLAVIFKEPIGFFELEMTYQELANKMASIESDIPLRKLTSEMLTPLDIDRFITTTSQLSQSPIYIDDTPAISIMELRVRARRMVEKYGVKAIFIDYIQLMKGELHTRKNREQEIASISRNLKLIAKELNIPIIALAQLSREVDKRPLPRIPILSDLRESGSLEQDADIVIFLWRPHYYKIQGDDGGVFMPGLTKLIIAKHRNGELGEPCLQMIGSTSKFKDIDSPYTHNQQQETPAESEPKSKPNGKDDDELPF